MITYARLPLDQYGLIPSCNHRVVNGVHWYKVRVFYEFFICSVSLSWCVYLCWEQNLSLNRQPSPAAATKYLFASTCYDFYSVVLVLHSDMLSTMMMLPRSMKIYLNYIVLQSFKMMLSAADPVFYLIDTSIIWLVQDTSHINALSLYMLPHNATWSHVKPYYQLRLTSIARLLIVMHNQWRPRHVQVKIVLKNLNCKSSSTLDASLVTSLHCPCWDIFFI